MNTAAATCPSGVDYRRLVDHARVYIEAHHKRALPDRELLALLRQLLHQRLFGGGLQGGIYGGLHHDILLDVSDEVVDTLVTERLTEGITAPDASVIYP